MLGLILYCCHLGIPNNFIFELMLCSAVDEIMEHAYGQEKTRYARPLFLAAPFTYSVLGAP